MPFTKGQHANPNGRPKGATNKVSAEQREFLREFLLTNKPKLKREMGKMKGGSYVQAYISLMHYILPKPATAELKEVPDLEKFIAMTPEERQIAMNEIQESLREDEAVEMRKEVIEENKRKRYGI